MLRGLLVFVAVSFVLPAGATAEQASQPASVAAGSLDVGADHACAVLSGAGVRCWGFGRDGRLGYADTSTIGDDETPAAVGPVDVGVGRTATAVGAGSFHTCALLDGGAVRCWGFGGNGRLGYGNTASIGDTETPGSVEPVELGGGRSAKAITVGGAHTCALLTDGTVPCWGFAGNGQLGYGDIINVGDRPGTTPDKVGPVNLGIGAKAVAVTAGTAHTCTLLDDGRVFCWGLGGDGRLGYGSTSDLGSTSATTPDKVGPVNLGVGVKASAITAGAAHTCALVDDGRVFCWGNGANGRLGYGNTTNVGDTAATTPDKVGVVNLGAGAKAVAISAGGAHTCALLDDGTVRCWGNSSEGELGYANTTSIGDNETPASLGPVDLGLGRRAVAISAGGQSTCARLDDGSVRCWGYAGTGRLGYCNENNVGDDETPGSLGPVDLAPGDGGARCAPPPSGGGPPTVGIAPPAASPAPTAVATKPAVVGSDAVRSRGLRSCLAGVATHAKRGSSLTRRGSARQRAKARRHLARHASSGRRRCLALYGRTPGPITGLRARALGTTQIELSFNAPGSDGIHAPPARSYVVKQSFRPIRGARDFAHAQTLCKSACRFTVSRVGAMVSLAVTDLHPHTTYYYAVVARDNVSARRGPRSSAVRARTR